MQEHMQTMQENMKTMRSMDGLMMMGSGQHGWYGNGRPQKQWQVAI